jgi:hypothetical protein
LAETLFLPLSAAKKPTKLLSNLVEITPILSNSYRNEKKSLNSIGIIVVKMK